MQDTALPAQPTDAPNHRRDFRIVIWLLQIRWTVLGLLVLGGTATWLAGLTPGATYISGLLLAGGVALYNLGFALLLRQAGPAAPYKPAWIVARWAQLPCDIVAVTLLLATFDTGGISPLTVFYGVAVMAAVAILPVRGIYLIAGFGILCYSCLVGYEWLIAPPDPAYPAIFALRPDVNRLHVAVSTAAIMAMTLGITAFVAARVARRLRDNEAQNRRQVANLTVLHRLAHDLAATLDVDEVLHTVTGTVHTLLDAAAVTFALVRPDGQAEFLTGSGLKDEERQALPRVPLPLDNPLVARLRRGEAVLAPDVDAQPGLRALLVRPQTASFYCFPMMVEEEAIGSLNINFDQRRVLSAEAIEMLAALANQAALALARARLYQEATRAALEMTSLYRIGLATASSLEIDEVLMQIYQQVQRVLAPDTFFIALCDPETQALHFELAIERGDILPLHQMPLGPNTVTAWVAETREPRLIRHWDRERDHLPAQIVQYGLDTQSAVSVPLIAKDKTVGVISVQKVAPDGFSGEDLRLLSSIAAPAALALENARLHEEMRARALRDSLTGAYNHAALLARLTAAVAQDRPVSLIMLDVDRFKEFNDQWGHQAGDVALRSLVAAIQANIKSVDTVGRWGGEEFGVVLPGARLDDAASVAARIRERLAATTLVDPTGRALPTPTVSQGVAAFPSCAADAPGLVDIADRALYHAKARGRNNIVLSRDAVFLDSLPKDPVR